MHVSEGVFAATESLFSPGLSLSSCSGGLCWGGAGLSSVAGSSGSKSCEEGNGDEGLHFDYWVCWFSE